MPNKTEIEGNWVFTDQRGQGGLIRVGRARCENDHTNPLKNRQKYKQKIAVNRKQNPSSLSREAACWEYAYYARTHAISQAVPFLRARTQSLRKPGKPWKPTKKRRKNERNLGQLIARKYQNSQHTGGRRKSRSRKPYFLLRFGRAVEALLSCFSTRGLARSTTPVEGRKA